MAVPGHLRSRRAMFGIPHQRREEFDRAALVHVPELLRVASRLCSSADAGEDLLQETYLQAWRSFHRFEAGTNCRAWLYKILLFTYSAQNRKRARQPFLVDLDAAGETALLVDAPTPDTLTAEAVKAAFDRLPEHFRTLVLLVDVEGLTYREAAEALDVPIGTVMSRLSRGRGLAAPGAGAVCTGIVTEREAEWTCLHSEGCDRESGLPARTRGDGLVSLRGALGRDQPWRAAPRGPVPRLRGGTEAPAAVARAAVTNARRCRGRRSRAGAHHARRGSRAALVGTRRTSRCRCRDADRRSRRRVLGGQAVSTPPPMMTRPRITSPVRSPTPRIPRTIRIARRRASSHRSSILPMTSVWRTASTT